MNHKESYIRDARIARGLIISSAIDVEQAIEYCISVFYGNSQDEAFPSSLEIDVLQKMTFDQKIKLIKKLSRRHGDVFFESALKELDKIREKRNKVAHMILYNPYNEFEFDSIPEPEKFVFYRGYNPAFELTINQVSEFEKLCKDIVRILYIQIYTAKEEGKIKIDF